MLANHYSRNVWTIVAAHFGVLLTLVLVLFGSMLVPQQYRAVVGMVWFIFPLVAIAGCFYLHALGQVVTTDLRNVVALGGRWPQMRPQVMQHGAVAVICSIGLLAPVLLVGRSYAHFETTTEGGFRLSVGAPEAERSAISPQWVLVILLWFTLALCAAFLMGAAQQVQRYGDHFGGVVHTRFGYLLAAIIIVTGLAPVAWWLFHRQWPLLCQERALAAGW